MGWWKRLRERYSSRGKIARVGVTAAVEEAFAKYQRGEYEAAKELLRPFAQQGDARAQFDLGFLYETGQGISQDQHEAVKWIRRAADQGHPRAQYALGLHYEKGDGVPQDHIQAYKWLDLAAARNATYSFNPAASVLRDAIATAKMTQEQIVEGQRLAREWTPARNSGEEKYGRHHSSAPGDAISDAQFFGDFLIGQQFMNIRFNISEEKYREFFADVPSDLRDLMSLWSMFYLLWLMRMAFRLKRGEEFEAEMMRAAYGRLMGATQELDVSSMTVPFARAMRQWFDRFDNEVDAAVALKTEADDKFAAVEWKVALAFLLLDSDSPYYVDAASHTNDQIDRAAVEGTSRMNGLDFVIANALAKAKNAALHFILLAPEMKRLSGK